MTMLTWQRLQEEQRIWSTRNFGEPETRPPLHPLYGLIEEVGEFAHSTLKAEQKIRGDASKHAADRKDAIGDMVIFLSDFLGLRGWKYADILPAVSPEAVQATYKLQAEQDPVVSLSIAIGRLAAVVDPYAMAFRAEEEGPLGVEAVQDIVRLFIRTLAGICTREGWSFQEVVETTWTTVKKRDWTKDKTTGAEPVVTSGAIPGPKDVQATLTVADTVAVDDTVEIKTSKAGGGRPSGRS
jgi:hypothetical protein